MDDLTQLEDEELDRRLALASYDLFRLKREWRRRLRERNPVPKRSDPASETSSAET